MTDTLKKLRSVVDAMTPAPWTINMSLTARDAFGIIALRNTAPALLDLAEAVATITRADVAMLRALACDPALGSQEHGEIGHLANRLTAVLDASKKLEGM